MTQTTKRSDRNRAAMRALERRVAALERRLAPCRARSVSSVLLPQIERRARIIEEDRLRRRVEREQAFRRDTPDLWRKCEQARRDRNRAKALLNARLRAAGLDPVPLEPSLKQDVQKLKRLEAQNLAESAIKRA